MKKMNVERKAAIDKMRSKMAAKLGGSQRDPGEFKPAKVESGQDRDYYFWILPPFNEDEIFVEKNGYHYIENRFVQCPRVTNNDDCPVCKMAFELMEGVEDKKQRSAIARKFLPQQKYAMNILFTDDQVNGEFAGKVMWFNAPLTVFKKMEDAFMRDDPGEDSRKPKAYGDFFNPDEAYVFNLKVTEKGGFNNYEQSGFLTEQPGPITNKDAALKNRFNLRSKFPEPDMALLNGLVEKAMNGDMDEDEEVTEHITKAESKTDIKADAKPDVKVSTTKEVKTEVKKVVDTKAISEYEDPELERLMSELK